MKKTVVESLRRSPVFSGAEPESLPLLAERGETRSFRQGEYLFRRGDEAADVYLLLAGRLEITWRSPAGRRQLLAVLDPPAFFGELGVLGEIGRTASVRALDDSKAWVLPGPTFREFLGEQPEPRTAITRALARQVDARAILTEELLFLDLKGRVARRLLGLVPSRDPSAGDRCLPVTQTDLASLAGGSREEVARILSEFRRRGIIERAEHAYVLHDIDALRRLGNMAGRREPEPNL